MSTSTRAAHALLEEVLAPTLRAPSVHNTQPWRWSVDLEADDPVLELHADRSRQLRISDPVGRNLTISCGAALHHARTVAYARGWAVTVAALPDPRRRDLLARLVLRRGQAPADAHDLLRAVEERCTDRRRFTAWPIPEERLATLAEIARSWGAIATVVASPTDRVRVELLVHRATIAQSRDRRYADEQRGWLDHGGFDGIPSPVLAEPAASAGSPGQRPTRFVPEPDEGPESTTLLQSTDGLLVLGTPTDGVLDWLDTGQALSALWLRAASTGLSVVPLSQVVEVDETRYALRHEVLGPRLLPQILVRIGWQEIGRSQLVRTPRRPLADVVHALP